MQKIPSYYLLIEAALCNNIFKKINNINASLIMLTNLSDSNVQEFILLAKYFPDAYENQVYPKVQKTVIKDLILNIPIIKASNIDKILTVNLLMNTNIPLNQQYIYLDQLIQIFVRLQSITYSTDCRLIYQKRKSQIQNITNGLKVIFDVAFDSQEIQKILQAPYILMLSLCYRYFSKKNSFYILQNINCYLHLQILKMMFSRNNYEQKYKINVFNLFLFFLQKFFIGEFQKQSKQFYLNKFKEQQFYFKSGIDFIHQQFQKYDNQATSSLIVFAKNLKLIKPELSISIIQEEQQKVWKEHINNILQNSKRKISNFSKTQFHNLLFQNHNIRFQIYQQYVYISAKDNTIPSIITDHNSYELKQYSQKQRQPDHIIIAFLIAQETKCLKYIQNYFINGIQNSSQQYMIQIFNKLLMTIIHNSSLKGWNQDLLSTLQKILLVWIQIILTKNIEVNAKQLARTMKISNFIFSSNKISTSQISYFCNHCLIKNRDTQFLCCRCHRICLAVKKLPSWFITSKQSNIYRNFVLKLKKQFQRNNQLSQTEMAITILKLRF